VINFDSPGSQPMKSRLTRRVARSRADDHEKQMTSPVILATRAITGIQSDGPPSLCLITRDVLIITACLLRQIDTGRAPKAATPHAVRE
jgi:hypothetical protein